MRVDGQRVRLWDGLVTSGDHTVLVRLVRSEGAPVALRFELTPGRVRPRADLVTRPDRSARRTAGSMCPVRPGHSSPKPHRWTGIAISTAGRSFDVDELIGMLERAERRDRQAMDRISLPRRHPSRATDALRVLRALTDPRSGAPVAAPTTSLPEAPGGERQFDYRYSWLRDSALAVSTATMLGHLGAAGDYLDFVGDLLDREGSHLTPLTRSSGGPVPAEREVDGVEGWASSRPVRVGNAATEQRQLDAVASVIEAVSIYVFGGGRLTRRRRAMVEHLASLLADTPPGPTSGIWELREPAHLVSEELARWHGLDRALALMRRRRPWRRHPTWRRRARRGTCTGRSGLGRRVRPAAAVLRRRQTSPPTRRRSSPPPAASGSDGIRGCDGTCAGWSRRWRRARSCGATRRPTTASPVASTRSSPSRGGRSRRWR